MNVMLLGGSGFVGGHLARRLSRDGHRITVVTRHAPSARRLKIIPGLKLMQFNPYDVERLTLELDGHDALINLVGILNESGRDGSGFKRANVDLVRGAIEACKGAGIRRFIQMSSLRAGEGESHYLKTRGQAEELVRDSGLDWTIFRPSTIFGPDDSFLNRFATLLTISPMLPLARAETEFAPVYVGDVVEAFARALPDSDSYGQTFELCGAERVRLREVVEWVAHEKGMRRAVFGLPDALGRLQGMVLDFVPGKPFSSDNFKSLLLNSVCSDDGFARLGIDPWGMREKAREWLQSDNRQSRYQEYRRGAGRE